MAGMHRPFLAVLVIDLALLITAVLAYRPFLDQPRSAVYLLEPVAMLLVYAVAAWVMGHVATPDQRRVMRVAGIVGAATGALEVANISVETFTDLSGPGNLAATAPFILGPFAIWGLLGGWTARGTRSLGLGVLAALSAAMVTMVLGVTYGFVLVLAAPERLTRILGGDPDFIRSGWSDVRAYVLANAFDNGFTHLAGALLVGSVVGLLGSTVGLAPRPANVAP